MKTLIILLTSLVCLSLASFAKENETPKAFIKRWAEDFNKNDPAVISQFYEKSDELEMLVSVGMWHHGYDEMLAAYIHDSQDIKYYDSQIKNIRTRVFDNTAIVGFEHLFKFRVLDSNTHYQIHIRTTSTLRKVNGKWFIVLEHSSPIRDIPRAVLIETSQAN